MIDNKSSVHEAYIRKQLDLSTGQSIGADELNAAVQRLYNTDEFQRVDASVVDDGVERHVVVTSEEKSWGPNFLEFGIGWETNFTDESSVDLDFAYMERDLTEYGGEWRTQLELGHESALNSELYLPLTATRSFYSRSMYSFETIDFKVPSDVGLSLSVEQKAHQITQGLGYNISQNSYVELGVLVEKGELHDDFLLNDEVKFDTLGAYVSFGFDNLSLIHI